MTCSAVDVVVVVVGVVVGWIAEMDVVEMLKC